MQKLLLITACALALCSHAYADTDFSDESITCDSDSVADDVSNMIENSMPGKIGLHLIYTKDQKELSRSSDKLVCNVTLVLSTTQM